MKKDKELRVDVNGTAMIIMFPLDIIMINLSFQRTAAKQYALPYSKGVINIALATKAPYREKISC